MKVCNMCLLELPLTEFYNSKLAKDGKYNCCKPCGHLRTKQWQLDHPEQHRRHMIRGRLKYEYGITLEDYEALVLTQGGACAICGTTPKAPKRLVIDHDHATGAVRSLLCIGCNWGLGHFKDSPPLLRRAADYLSSATNSVSSESEEGN